MRYDMIYLTAIG